MRTIVNRGPLGIPEEDNWGNRSFPCFAGKRSQGPRS